MSVAQTIKFRLECVIALSKGEIDSKKVRVEFSLEGMDTSGLQKGATYPEIKARVLVFQWFGSCSAL